MSTYELISNAYRLPWTADNNPNGWIEPTTFCQLKCPGCYRGLDKDGVVPIHEDFDEMKRQVDQFVKTRNVQTISIAGGEPLLYPKLAELLSYIKSHRLKSKIFTNGVALKETVLRKLKEAGANEFVVHVDTFQVRAGHRYATEAELVEVRDYLCQLFKKVGGVNLGFIQPFSKDNISDVAKVVAYCKKNADVVSLIVSTIYSDVNWTKQSKTGINTEITVSDIVEEIQGAFPYQPCAYLGSTSDQNDPSWLFSISVGFRDFSLGFFDGQLYEKIQSSYYIKTGRYLFTRVGNKITVSQLIKLMEYKCIRGILKNYIQAILKNPRRVRDGLYLQTHLTLRGPKFTKDGARDLCEGCPDAMFYDNKLVPSCILDEIKVSTLQQSVKIAT